MILRRITDAFRRQDWFTVAVETMIVVLGVFLGLQVNNWNEERVTREREALVMARLLSDHQEMADQTETSIEVYVEIFGALSRLMEEIGAGAALPEDAEQIELDLHTALTGSLAPQRSPVITELLSAGEMNLISDDELRAALLELDVRIQRTTGVFNILFDGNMVVEEVFISKIVFENNLSAEGLPLESGVLKADIDAMRSDPAVLSSISVRRRNAAFMLQWLHGLRQDIIDMQTKLESKT